MFPTKLYIVLELLIHLIYCKKLEKICLKLIFCLYISVLLKIIVETDKLCGVCNTLTRTMRSTRTSTEDRQNEPVTSRTSTFSNRKRPFPVLRRLYTNLI